MSNAHVVIEVFDPKGDEYVTALSEVLNCGLERRDGKLRALILTDTVHAAAVDRIENALDGLGEDGDDWQDHLLVREPG